MNKEAMRLLVLQVAAIASIFGNFSPRLMAAVRFLQTIASPEIWDELWNIFQAHQRRSGTSNLTESAPRDPFTFIDELARRSQGGVKSGGPADASGPGPAESDGKGNQENSPNSP